MPDPNSFQPSLAPPAEPATGRLRRCLHALVGFLALVAIAVMLWAPFLALIPGAPIDALGGTARIRLLGLAAFAALLIARFLIRPPKKPSRRSVVWGDFARATGGALSEDPRRHGLLGWTGGVTVRWKVCDVEVKLSASADTGRNDLTQLAADVRLTRGFQFHLVRESTVAKMFFSNQLWHVALAAIREREGNSADSAGIAGRLAFMAEDEILVGDPTFDDAFLLKSDGAAHAREFFGDAGVASCVHELDRNSKGWQLSLMACDNAGTYRLTLAMPGSVLDPEGLDASRKLIEASIRRFADRGMLASPSPRAA